MREGKREIQLRTRFDSDLHLTRLQKIKESSEASQLTGEKDTFGGGGNRGGSAKFNYLATDAPLLNLKKKRKRKMAVRVVKRKKKVRRGGGTRSPTVIRLPFFKRKGMLYITCVCVCVLAHVDARALSAVRGQRRRRRRSLSSMCVCIMSGIVVKSGTC